MSKRLVLERLKVREKRIRVGSRKGQAVGEFFFSLVSTMTSEVGEARKISGADEPGSWT